MDFQLVKQEKGGEAEEAALSWNRMEISFVGS
jgi:hypothetical protein